MEIILYPNQTLRSKPILVTDFSNIDTTVNEMKLLLVDKKGVGLAANQVGLDMMMFIIDDSSQPFGVRVFVNPIITKTEGKILGKEGCLSFPGIYENIVRNKKIKVNYFDERGNERVLEADGFLSQVIQHEIDHLNGVLFIDKMKYPKRARIQRIFCK